MMPGGVELIPGTALPFHVGSAAAPAHGDAPEAFTGEQTEGRGAVGVVPFRAYPPGTTRGVEELGLSPAEFARLVQGLRAYDRRARKLEEIFDTTARQTDATTGNVAIPLFQAPAGTLAEVTNVTVDVPTSTTITPTAPFANAASFSYLAVGNFGTTGLSNAQASSGVGSLRQGLVAFLPTAAGGPILPGQFLFSDKNSPILQANETVYFCMVGGSIAAVLNVTIQVTYRVRLFGFERGVS